MSTRSGKRRHNSFLENILKPDVKQVTESVKKRKSSRLKENVEEFSVTIAKNKKRTNYVTYPSVDDEVEIDAVDSKENEGNYVRVLRKNALREQNLVASTYSVEPPTDVKKLVRTTRRTQKLAEDTRADIQESQSLSEGEANKRETQKSKHGKKKKLSIPEPVNEEIVILKKNTKKKGKKVKKSGSMVVEDIESQNNDKKNRSMSVDSFHSAAGSPCNDLEDNSPFEMVTSPKKQSEKFNTTFDKNSSDQKLECRRTRSTSRLSGFSMSLNNSNKTFKETQKRKSSVKNLDRITLIDDINKQEGPINSTINRALKKRKSSIVETVSKDVNSDLNIDQEIKNSTYDLEDLEKEKSKRSFASEMENSIKRKSLGVVENSDQTNTTFDKDDVLETGKSAEDIIVDKNRLSDDKYEETAIQVVRSATEKKNRQSAINATFEKSVNNSQIDAVIEPITQKPLNNTTFEKDSDPDTNLELGTRKSLLKNSIIDNLPSETCSETPIGNKSPRKSILSVSSQKVSLEINSTYDKIEKSDSTYDKDKNLDATFDKSSKSSLISSDSSNVTMDKSRISITSDDSRENIVNTTPVLIESSFDDTVMNSSKVSLQSPSQAPMTPLKREGTFTKDGPEVLESPKAQLLKTPTKHMSLSSPGCTPFHPMMSASKEMSVANITRSIEKSRRSSLAEPLPRTTKVMFCSPVNNPAVVLQQRRKVIKSNLKGSNKSFVMEDNATTEPRPARRKRSYTQSDAEDTRVKRKRLVDGLQHSVDRLSRPRTASASAKLPDPGTPSKKPITPKKSELKISRTKLPNFAALHRKEFDKMESLNECQERKAKRAKRLLTPTGAVTMLERISPKENGAEPEKSPNEGKEDQTEPKDEKHSKEPVKPETPVKSLPTLKSLNSGYTRFGFKLNLDANPFSVPTKTDAKNQSLFNFSNKKDSKAKTKLFTFSSRKDKKDNTKLLDIRSKLTRPAILPSLAGTTSVRKEAAKQAVMREKSFTDRRNINRDENRTIIKGVRTNRRFDLQMRMRNLD